MIFYCLFLPKEKNMPKLKTIIISGCNLSSCHELQPLWTLELKESIAKRFYNFRQSRCLHNHTELPQKLYLELLDIESRTYLNPSFCKSTIAGSHLKTFHFSHKWKKPPVWKLFWWDFDIQFGLYFMTFLDNNVRGFRSSCPQEQ